jgi:hypothetical protein
MKMNNKEQHVHNQLLSKSICDSPLLGTGNAVYIKLQDSPLYSSAFSLLTFSWILKSLQRRKRKTKFSNSRLVHRINRIKPGRNSLSSLAAANWGEVVIYRGLIFYLLAWLMLMFLPSDTHRLHLSYHRLL